MKSKCSFILKASTALVLALLMLFGTVATSFAAVVDTAGTGANVDLATSGANFTSGKKVYFDNSWTQWSNVYLRVGHTTYSSAYQMSKVTGTNNIYSYTIPSWANYDAFAVANNAGWTGSNSIYKVDTGDSYDITASTNYLTFSVSSDIMIIPKSTNNTDDGCTYYNVCGVGNATASTTSQSTFTTLNKSVSVTSVSHGTVSAAYTTGSGGTIAESSSASILYGSTLTISQTPDTGYHAGSYTGTCINDASSTTSSASTCYVGYHTTPTTACAITGAFEENTYYLLGLKNDYDWDADSDNKMTYNSTSGLYEITRNLYSGSTTYGGTDASNPSDTGFKVYYSGDGSYYGKDSTCLTSSSTSATLNSSGKNVRLTTKDLSSATSNKVPYKFTFNASTKALNVYYPMKVTYNMQSHGTNPSANGYVVAYGSTITAPTAPTATGYTFGGWYKESACTNAWNFSTDTVTADTVLYAKWTAKTYTVTLDANTNGGKIKKTSTSSDANTVTFTHTYGAADTISSQYYSITPPTGYTFDGWYDSASGGTKYTSVGATAITAAKTYYAHYTEVTAGATVKVCTDGSTSNTAGGTVKVGTNGTAGTSVTISNSSFGIATASSAIIKASTASGYTFKGWQFNSTHLKYSFDGTTYTAVASTSTTYGTSSDTTVYLKTDGTSGMTTANTEIRAMFESAKYTITYSGKYTDDGSTWNNITSSQGTFTVTNNSGGATVTSGSTVNYNSNLTITATPASGYVVDGIYYRTTSTGTWNKMETSTNASTGAVYNNTFNVKSNWFFEARFKKVYHISLYNTTEEVGGDFRYVTGPPMRVTVTPSGGTAVTYTYKKNASATSEGYTRTSGDYNEGDLLTVYAGDTVVLSYAALASSDTITGVFFNNARRYTCEGENDNLYKLREYKAAGWGTDGDDSWDYDYMAATTLYANENYYEGSVATTIAGQKANYQAKDGVDNNMHTVTFVAKSDYLNIDLEIATKRQFIFTDETGLDIRSEMMDNYYNPLSEVSASSATTKFGIKLATSDTCTYDWGTGAKVKFYRDAACTNEITGVFTVASSADSSGYFVISGTMPNYNVYIKPNIVTKYQVSLGTVMLADVSSNNYQYWNQAADVSLNYGGTKYKNEKYDGITAPSNCIKAITKGDTVTFISSNYNDKTQYTFLGWYKGTSTGPDYKNGLLSEKETFNFIPRENTYVYAVGTRDLFINGCKYITGATNDWNRTGNNDPVNFKMEFDPTKGTKGMYYWELDAETLYAAVSSTGYTNGGGVTENGSHWYWSNNTNMGNSWFQIMDSPTGWDRSAVWGANNDSDFKTTETNKIEYGKIRKGTSGDDWKAVEACGYIKFKESDSPGWSAPLRIYVDPTATGANKGRFTVEPTPTYSNLYVSNGFDVGGTSRDTATTVTVPTGETSFTIKSEGDGWNPDHEGHVQHFIPQKKNAKVRITKTCSANEKVVAFDVFDIDNDDFYSRTDVTASGNNYYIDFQCTMQQNLYIVPVIQEKAADLTINFDGTQLNKTQWGEIVTAYAWYSDDSSTHALGAYPGQPMVVSDDGNTWTAAIPSERTISGTKYTLAGILFTNYVDGNHSWLGCGSVMGTEQNAGTQSISTTGGIIQTYNIMKDTDYRDGTYHGTYNKANFKAQTYDYREPVAIYNNAPKGNGVKTTITFAMKDGDSSLISWKHSELTGNNILNLPSGWTALRWEYLTNSTGKKYSDLNGQPMEGTPTATYYIAAKGQVIYKNDSMTHVYYGGKSSDAPSPAVNYGLPNTSINFNYAVQWYVYDAQGNYITNVLSAAFADQKDGMSYIAKQLDDLGYAVDGKSVAICYDKPRYMYTDDGGVINSGANFDAYRFEGQWYATVQTEPVTVSVGVGMMTENGEVIADNNHPGYGDATAAYSTTYGTATYAHSSDGDKSVTVALADASKRLVKLDANATNFVGWYYYDANTNKFTKASYKNATDFYPNFNADVTYYAMYEAKAVYQYNYTGREGAKTFSVAGGALTDAEMTDGNKVSKSRTDFGSKSPGASDVTVFKKNISFNTTITSGMLNNNTPYIMNINNATITDASYTVTAHYRNASGNLITKAKTATYNTPVDFTYENSGTSLPSVYAGHKFLGWFECDANGENIGNLLSTQANYGMVVVKNQHIIAVYENDGSGKTVSDSDVFTLFADDHEITREKYSASTGTYYNDTIIRLRNDSTGNLTSLPSGAEVGILVINANDSGQSTVVSNQANLTNFASNLTNGQTAAVGSKGRTVTKVSTTTLNKFGRADLALRCDYGTVNGTAYSVYAYYKNPSGAYTFVTVSESGTYSIG